MRTGKYRFATRYTQRRWFVPPRLVQVLMVEHEEPVGTSMTRARVWREATEADVVVYEERERIRQINAEELRIKHDRLRDRLDDMSGELQAMASRATLL